MSGSANQHDGRVRRCPRLGHQVSFSYCRAPGADLPCSRVADCWWEAFDVEAFLREHYTAEQLQQILQPAKPKAVSLVEMIEQARRRAAEALEGPADADS